MHKNLQIVEMINQFDFPTSLNPIFGILKRLRYTSIYIYNIMHTLSFMP